MQSRQMQMPSCGFEVLVSEATKVTALRVMTSNRLVKFYVA